MLTTIRASGQTIRNATAKAPMIISRLIIAVTSLRCVRHDPSMKMTAINTPASFWRSAGKSIARLAI
jgi:hypothetical protein